MTGPAAAAGIAAGRDFEVVLDLSRLLSRVLHGTPTGVDRVEIAYARGLMREIPDRLAFGAVHPLGRYGRIPKQVAQDFLDRTEARWSGAERLPDTRAAAIGYAVATSTALWPRPVEPGARRRVFLQSSPHHLHDEALTQGILRREGAAFVCLLHDLIPIQFPEYARPGGNDLHLRRIRTLARLADGLIANSDATRLAFLPHLRAAGRDVPVEVAHLGVAPPVAADMAGTAAAPPYFLCLGTIEPRKNHLLLLNVWRRMRELLGTATPKLVLVGRRGWENEQVIDMLERCPALVGYVEEHGRLDDRAVNRLIAGARALLLPSFAEGYGLPVIEALALGVPVLCSDLPALREAGGDVPDFLDPLDGLGWLARIAELAATDSAAERAQRARMAGWRAPGWKEHIAIVLDLLHKLAR